MIATSCLLFFIGFLVWMSTSKRIAWADKPAFLQYMQRVKMSKTLSVGLFITATAMCIRSLGPGSGAFASGVLLMTMGGVCVIFFPFSWLRLRYVGGLYLMCLLLEVV